MSLMKHLFRCAYEDYRRGNHHEEYGDDHGGYRRHGHSYPEGVSMILRRLSGGGRMLLWVLAGLTAFLILVLVGLVVVLMPLLSQALDYVNHNGLKGVADILTGVLGKIWEGSGK